MDSALSDIVGQRVHVYMQHPEPWNVDESIYLADVKALEGTVVHLVNGSKFCKTAEPRESFEVEFDDCFINLASPRVSAIEVSDSAKCIFGEDSQD